MRNLVIFLAVTACQSPLSASIEAYREARYPDARMAFRAVNVAELEESRRAEAQLYSGLTHLALGDRDLAARDLSAARAALERDPALLCPEDQGRLFTAWRALGRPPGRSLSAP